MTGFLLWAVPLALAAALFVAVPMLRKRADGAPAARVTAVVSALLVAAVGAGLYARLGNTAWFQQHAASSAADSGVVALVQATEQHPDDPAAWLALGRGYLASEQVGLARRSFQRANTLSNGTNAAALSGMAQTLIFENDNRQNEAALRLFERALAIDPHQPQALFYTAVALMNAGNLEEARTRFTAMLALDAPPQVGAALRKQIAAIDAQIAAGHASAGTVVHLNLQLAPALQGRVPGGAALFVFVRSPQGGPPLAVKRLVPTFPQQVDLSGADAVIAGRGIEAGKPLLIVARISASGNPTGSAGDLYGELNAVAGKGDAHTLLIDRQQAR